MPPVRTSAPTLLHPTNDERCKCTQIEKPKPREDVLMKASMISSLIAAACNKLYVALLWKPSKTVHSLRGRKKGSGPGFTKRVVWENSSNQINSCIRDPEKLLFPKRLTFVSHLHININSLQNANMVRMVHMNTFKGYLSKV